MQWEAGEKKARLTERLLCNPITLEAAPPWQWCAHTQDLTEVSETGRARNASSMTDEKLRFGQVK